MLDDYIHSSFDSLPKKRNTNSSKQQRQQPASEQEGLSPIKSEKKNHNNQSKSNADEPHNTDSFKDKLQEFIGHFDHFPRCFNGNPFIRTGYRINFSTPKKILKSLFMIHNESINIWTHLGGAIILIILCVGLSLSVSSIDTQNLERFVQKEVNDLFDPIYNRLPDFSQIEHDISERISQTKEDLTKFGEKTLLNLEAKLEGISNEIEHVKNDIKPETIGRLLNKLKEQLEMIPESLTEIKDSVSHKLNKKKLEDLSGELKKKVNELQKELLIKIDSTDFDWIDIYKYINSDHNSSITLREGYHEMPLSKWPIIVFLLSAVFCLLCSATFHLFYCLSQRANQILLRLDYAGVSILITGSCFPPFVYGFYCQPIYSQIYLTIIGVTSIIVFFVSLGDKIHSEAYTKIKSMMYGGLGVLAGLPALHLIYLSYIQTGEKTDILDFVPSIPYYLGVGGSYLGGLIIYASKFPERCHPGKFDILGHSHQIWHVCVLAGIVFTYFGSFDIYYMRIKIPCIGCEI